MRSVTGAQHVWVTPQGLAPPVDTETVPSLSQNLSVWGGTYDWSKRGDEWSHDWGGVSYQWWTTLFPRLQGYVPAGRILEIAPGYGRWTHFLRDLCDELVIVDIAEQAIEYCRTRFASDDHVTAHVNDGTSLAMVQDGSIDLAFSFDSLVHAESEVIGGYLTELARILAFNGVAFIHHSNMGSYPPGSFDPHNIHWRATSVSAALVEEQARSVGLCAISQETVAWGNETLMNDCFSVIAREGSRWERENVVVENLDFSRTEIGIAHRLSTQYPPFDRRLRARMVDPARTSRKLASATMLAEEGQTDEAYELLRDELRQALDPELLNDLAVLAAARGSEHQAGDLLRCLLALHPEYAPAAQNLSDLEAL
jgi:SAM-dependent methyltransferase